MSTRFFLQTHIMVTKMKVGYKNTCSIDYSSTILGNLKPIFFIRLFLHCFTVFYL